MERLTSSGHNTALQITPLVTGGAQLMCRATPLPGRSKTGGFKHWTEVDTLLKRAASSYDRRFPFDFYNV